MLMDEKTRILYVIQEMTPFLELTPVAEFARKLPQAIQEKGMEIRVFMPRFGCINERRNRLHEVIRLSGMNIIVNDTDNPLIIKVASIPQARMQVYFLDNEDYFERKHAFSNGNNKSFKDNADRMLFFCKGVLETVKKLGWMPHIIHCHDWMTGLVPLLLKTRYSEDPMYSDAKVIYSVYPNTFSDSLGPNLSKIIKLDKILDTELKYYKDPTNSNLHKAAIHYSDAVIVGNEKIDTSVQNFINTQSDKPQLAFQPNDECVDSYYNFYNQLIRSETLAVAD